MGSTGALSFLLVVMCGTNGGGLPHNEMPTFHRSLMGSGTLSLSLNTEVWAIEGYYRPSRGTVIISSSNTFLHSLQ
jgi:hypothetical protein